MTDTVCERVSVVDLVCVTDAVGEGAAVVATALGEGEIFAVGEGETLVERE